MLWERGRGRGGHIMTNTEVGIDAGLWAKECGQPVGDGKSKDTDSSLDFWHAELEEKKFICFIWFTTLGL